MFAHIYVQPDNYKFKIHNFPVQNDPGNLIHAGIRNTKEIPA